MAGKSGVMTDVAVFEPEILAKMRCLLKNQVAIGGTFEENPQEKKQLQSLRDSVPTLVETPQQSNVGADLPKLLRHDIAMDAPFSNFLGLMCEPPCFYERSGYAELYQHVAQKWEGKRPRVVLLGNAGTGKSWFQIYALKKLLDSHKCKSSTATGAAAKPDYDLVVRQVKNEISIFDLTKAEVWRWKIAENELEYISRYLTRTLYFFEPGGNPDKRPAEVFWPSLSTLSPYEDRIKEYGKRWCSRAYFWPWTCGEMWTMVCDSTNSIQLDFDLFWERYYKFGGVLRHVLGEDEDADKKLTVRMNAISVDILTSIALNVDRKEEGHNVSGFLVCYDNRWVARTDRFETMNLEYTSQKVEEAVSAKLHQKTKKEKMDAVLRRLSGEMIDLSGKMLEDVAMELLSKGSAYSWYSVEVGTGANLRQPRITKRKIVRIYDIDTRFKQPDLIIAPSNMRYPVGDFLFSCPDVDSSSTKPASGKQASGGQVPSGGGQLSGGKLPSSIGKPTPLGCRPQNNTGQTSVSSSDSPVVIFQCTWQLSHQYTVRALYDLRGEHLKIEDDRVLEIYIVSPDDEANCGYRSKQKDEFLSGDLNVDLKFTASKTISRDRLRSMWNSTRVFVFCPETSWQGIIEDFISKS